MRKLTAVFIALLVWGGLNAGLAAAQADSVSMSASVNGRDIATATVKDPLRLQPDDSVDVAVSVTNNTDKAIDIRRVVLRGRVLGLTFFTYASSVDFTVAAGSSGVFNYRLDLTDLGAQATGLVTGQLSVTDSSNTPIATVDTVTDVRGSLMSVYGLFGIALVVLTALAVIDAAVAIARRRMSDNRWQRGLRLLAPGVGIGLILAFSASVARLWVPATGQWLLIASLTAVGFFALGYLSPTPDTDDDDDDDDGENDVDEVDFVDFDDDNVTIADNEKVLAEGATP